MADIYVNYGDDPCAMTLELLENAEVARKIAPGMSVVIKPNLVVSRPAGEGATTHPQVVEGVVRFLQDRGIRRITIAEGSWVGDSTQAAFRNCGFASLAQKYGVKLLDTKGDAVIKCVFQGLELNICRSVAHADYLINIPVLKAHCQTNMTCCLKNLKGCIPDAEKRRYHTMGLHRPIAALNAVLQPRLHIVDAICGDLTFEEGGNPVRQDRMLLGFDPVALDSYCAGLLGYQPEEIEHLQLAAQYGVGKLCDDTTSIDIINPGRRPKASGDRSRKAAGLRKYIEEDSACSACYAALIFALDKVGGHLLMGQEIKIGQGYRGKAATGLGIGNCTSRCTRHIPGCPPKAVDIVEGLKRYEAKT